MDAIEFIKERSRMCESFYPDCEGCRIDEVKPVINTCVSWVINNAEKAVQIVEDWSTAHPRRTRQNMFLSLFPTGQLDESGILAVCPAGVDVKRRDPDGAGCGNVYKSCATCRREFWTQEVE